MRNIVPGLLLSLLVVGSATLQSQVQPRDAEPNQLVNLRIAQPPTQVVHRAESLNAGLQPTARVWILQQAKAEAQRPAPDLDTLDAVIRQRLADSTTGSSRAPSVSGGFAQQDIEAVAFIVMMQATQDNEEDLKSQMAAMQAINQQKGAERKLLDDLNSELSRGNQRDLSCTSAVCRSLSPRVESINQTNANLGRPSRFQANPDMSYQQLENLQFQLNQNLESMNELSDMTSMRLQMTMDRRSKFIQTLSNIEKKITDTSSAIVQNMK